jgi:hypothetical protein
VAEVGFVPAPAVPARSPRAWSRAVPPGFPRANCGNRVPARFRSSRAVPARDSPVPARFPRDSRPLVVPALVPAQFPRVSRAIGVPGRCSGAVPARCRPARNIACSRAWFPRDSRALPARSPAPRLRFFFRCNLPEGRRARTIKERIFSRYVAANRRVIWEWENKLGSLFTQKRIQTNGKLFCFPLGVLGDI